MNVRTNPAGQVPARLLAQMRLVASKAKLSPALASAFADGAAERGMTAAQAEAVVQGLVFMATNPMARTVDDATLIKLTDEFLSECMGGADDPATAPTPTALAGQILLTHLAAEDAQKPKARVGASDSQWSQGHSWDSPRGIAMKAADGLAAALAPRLGLKFEPTMARDAGPFSLADVAMSLCRANGLRPTYAAEAIRMAGEHTGSDFSYTIGQGLTGVVGKGFLIAEPPISKVATEVPVVDYRQRNSVTLSAAGLPQKVLEGGEVQYITVSEKGEKAAKPDDYASMFAVSNQALANDSSAMGLLSDISRKMIQGSVAQFRNVLLSPLLANNGAGQNMSDGIALFHANHGNLAVTAAVLSVTTLGAARLAMRRQKDKQGVLLAIEPKILLVPPELEVLADQLVTSITPALTSSVNPFAERLEVLCEPGLTNATAWYLLGDPAMANGLTWASLEGASSPQVESKLGWGTLGMEFRLRWAIGAAFVETASWYKNAGL